MHARLPKVVVGAVVVSAALWGADPFLGTWKLNLEKSKFGAAPVPKAGTRTCVAQRGGMIKCTQDGVNAKGESTHMEYTVKYDGKDYPVTGSPTVDTVAAKRIDSRTQEWTGKKAGQVVGTVRIVVSKDGKTLTGTWSGKDPAGNPITYTTVSDKQ